MVDSGKALTRENGEPLHPATITDRFHTLVDAADRIVALFERADRIAPTRLVRVELGRWACGSLPFV